MKIATIKIPLGTQCLVVEDSHERIKWFRKKLPGCAIEQSPNYALSTLDDQNFDIIFLDHDCHKDFFVDPSDPEFLNRTFWRVAQYLHRNEFKGQVIIHSGNPVGARRMEALLAPVCKVVVMPFGSFDIEVV